MSKNVRLIRLLSILLILLPLFVQAAIYKSIDRDGNVIFSDTPQLGSKPVKIQPPQTFTPPSLTLTTTSTTTSSPSGTQEWEEGAASFKYEVFAISSPVNDATLRDNSGNMTVNITLVPPLRSEDKVQLIMDSRKIGSPEATTVFSLTNVDRGTHTLQANIINKKRVIVKSKPVTFHMHQARITPAGIRSEILRENLHAQLPHSGGRSGGGPLLMGGAPSSSSMSGTSFASKALSATNKKILNPDIDKIIEVYREAKLRREAAQNRAIFLQGQEPNLKMQGALPNPHDRVQGALPDQVHYPPLMQGQTPEIQIQGSIRSDKRREGPFL